MDNTVGGMLEAQAQHDIGDIKKLLMGAMKARELRRRARRKRRGEKEADGG